MDETVDAPAAVFALCDRESPAAEGVRARLAAVGREDARWFDVRDVDDLERAAGLVEGRIVVVTALKDLATLLWDGALDTGFWSSKRLEVEFVTDSAIGLGRSREESGGGAVQSDATAAFLRVLIDAWEIHRARWRRERTIAGFCLSLLAIAGAFVIVLLSR